MFEDRQSTWMILLGIGILVLIFVYYSRTREMEMFSNDLEDYYQSDATRGVDDFLVDTKTCSPSCCGGINDPVYDGLTSEEIMQNLSLQGQKTPFVRTNMTCGNGQNGVGCPCIDSRTYSFLVNHGENALTRKESCNRDMIEPTLFLRNPPENAAIGGYAGSGPARVSPADSQKMSYAEMIQSRKSMFSDTALLNDLYYQRPMQNISGVQMISPRSTN